ncbi:MAG: biopolymer transporter ExbD, partial [Verrucomicrobia bacterium]
QDFKPDIFNISVDKIGDIYVEKRHFSVLELHEALSNKFRVNTNFPVYISGDRDSKHGDVIRVLDIVRREGIQKVSFAIAPGKE